MNNIVVATTNAMKFRLAKAAADSFGINVIQKPVEIDEIQGTDADRIIRDKAMRAYEQLLEPLVVTDDSWNIVALNGFPGAYMKDVDAWLSTQQFLDLLAPVTDRRVFLEQWLAYYDGETMVVVSKAVPGTILTKPQGDNGHSWHPIVTLEGDNGQSIAEAYIASDTDGACGRRATEVWHTLFTNIGV